MSHLPAQMCKRCHSETGQYARVAPAGVDPLSHKKKAKFWRAMAASFPKLIDFLCNPADLGQVRTVTPHPLALVSQSASEPLTTP